MAAQREPLAVYRLGSLRGFLLARRGEQARWREVSGDLAVSPDGTQLFVVPATGGSTRKGIYGLGAQQASDRYSALHGQAPSSTRFVRVAPKGKRVDLGDVLHVGYVRTDGRSLIHEFRKPRPRLYRYGRTYIIAGGRYSVGPYGIEG